MRTFRVNILTLFLSLLTLSLFIVILFTHFRQQQSVMDFSRAVAERVVNLVVVRFQAMMRGSEQVTKIAAGFFPDIGDLTFENKTLVTYLLSVVKSDPNFANFYIGLPNGAGMAAYNRSFTTQRFYITDPTRPLPAQTAFAIHHFTVSKGPRSSEMVYLDAAFKELGSEVIPAVSYDVTTRPWYTGAVKNRGPFWTDFYPYFITADVGISIGNPVYDAAGNLLCVVGADLSFSLLSQFVQQQKIGKTGGAYILSSDGTVTVPIVTRAQHHSTDSSQEVIAQAFKNYEKTNRASSHFILEEQGVKYLTYITQLPSSPNASWMIVTVAPLSDFFQELFLQQRHLIWMMVGTLLLSVPIILYFAKRISSPIVTLATEVNKIGKLDLSSQNRIQSSVKEVLLIDHAIAAMRRVIRSFFKYVPQGVVSSLLQKKEEIVLGGQMQELTIFFSDIADFTAIAETCSVDLLNPLLSEYFGAMTQIIHETHGTVDKFLSDGIMAFWGAPIASPTHTADACVAALRCHGMLATLNAKRKEEGKPEFVTRFGINTGPVIVGNIGTEDRMNYTVIGDAVNTTFRLLKVDKEYHTSILLSEHAKNQLPPDFVLRPLDLVAVKGKKEKIQVYELVGKLWEQGVHPSADQIALCTQFTEAYAAMQRQELQQARALFAAIASRFPEDYPTQLHLKRLG